MTRRPIQAGIRGTGEARDRGALNDHLREAFSRWPAGVAVVAARDVTGVHGITVTSFAPVSVDPPLVLVCLHRDAPIMDAVQTSAQFSINFLAADQKRIANIFADRFPAGRVRFTNERTLLEDAPLSLACAVHALHDGGDHHIVVGRVEEVVLRRDAVPLVYDRREYTRPAR